MSIDIEVLSVSFLVISFVLSLCYPPLIAILGSLVIPSLIAIVMSCHVAILSHLSCRLLPISFSSLL